MEFLRGIIPVIDHQLFQQGLGESGHLRTLYEIVREQKVTTDQEAQKAIYGDQNFDGAYKKLKQRLRDRLTDHVLKYGVVGRNLDNYSSRYRKCMMQAFAARSLIFSNARLPATYIGENLIRLTMQYEYTDLTIMIASDLIFYYSSVNYVPAKLSRYRALLDKMEVLYQRELLAAKYYSELQPAFGTSRAQKTDKYLTKAIQYSETVSSFLQDANLSYQLLLMSYLVIAQRYELEQNYKALLKSCTDAIDSMRNRKVNRVVGFYLMDIHRIICHLQLKRYPEAEEIAKFYFEKIMTPGHYNWFVLKSYLLIGRLHSRNYQGAFDILTEVSNNKAYAKLPESLSQTWLVYDAHVQFLILTGKVNLPEGYQSRFRLYKFLNDIPIFAKDKRGLNIAILIMHALILLQQRKFSEIIDRVDALNQYCHRHLRRDETFRSNCFIKMLLKVAKADFNRKRAERYAEPLLNKLHAAPLVLSDQTIEVEIIPYEDLWEMALELLD